MKKILIASAIAATATAATTGSAMACPNGYKAVWIQGNKVCQLDASASDSLTSETKRELRSASTKKLQIQRN